VAPPDIENMLNAATNSSKDNASGLLCSQIPPKVVAALIILIIGWFIGKAAGKLVAGLLDSLGADDAVEKTFLGDMIRRSGMTVRGVFDALVR
jgi:hypothetical protein